MIKLFMILALLGDTSEANQIQVRTCGEANTFSEYTSVPFGDKTSLIISGNVESKSVVVSKEKLFFSFAFKNKGDVFLEVVKSKHEFDKLTPTLDALQLHFSNEKNVGFVLSGKNYFYNDVRFSDVIVHEVVRKNKMKELNVFNKRESSYLIWLSAQGMFNCQEVEVVKDNKNSVINREIEKFIREGVVGVPVFEREGYKVFNPIKSKEGSLDSQKASK